MAYRAIIRNNTTGLYCDTKGRWTKEMVSISVETKTEAARIAKRVNGEVVSVTPKKQRSDLWTEVDKAVPLALR